LDAKRTTKKTLAVRNHFPPFAKRMHADPREDADARDIVASLNAQVKAVKKD
jgi:hypothetical protein